MYYSLKSNCSISLLIQSTIPLKKQCFEIWILILLTIQLQGQSVISGRILDENNTPVGSANILLRHQADSVLFKAVLSDEKGNYQFSYVKPGNYLVAATYVGYKETTALSVIVDGINKTYIVDPIIAVYDSKLLEETYVKFRRPMLEQQIDRLVIHVQNSITAAGASALDVLERSPGISVDRQGNLLSLNGKSTVMVMINGKLSRMPIDALLQQLAGMPTSSIDRIEIMTNPSAKYDAEGDAGLINIILRKSTQQGISGNYSLAMGYSYLAKGAATGSLNYLSDKLSLFGEYSHTVDHLWQLWQFNWRTNNMENQASSNSLAYRDAVMRVHTARAGFDYFLTKKWTFSGLVSGFDNRWRMKAESENQEVQWGQQSKGVVETREVNHWQHIMGNMGLKYGSEKTEFILDADYLYYNNEQPTEYKNDFSMAMAPLTPPSRMMIDKKTPFSMLVFKADWARKLGNGWKLETGVKRSDLSLRNDVLTRHETGTSLEWQVDSLFSQQMDMNELIHGGYVNLNGSFSKKWAMQAGLRGESTGTLLTNANGVRIVDRKYFNVFPSV